MANNAVITEVSGTQGAVGPTGPTGGTGPTGPTGSGLTSIAFSGSTAACSTLTTFPSTSTFTLSSEKGLEIGCQLYKSATNINIALMISLDATKSYSVQINSDGTTKMYYRNGASATQVGGSGTTGGFAGMQYVQFFISPLAAGSNTLWAFVNGVLVSYGQDANIDLTTGAITLYVYIMLAASIGSCTLLK